jgi:hypothetical protein
MTRRALAVAFGLCALAGGARGASGQPEQTIQTKEVWRRGGEGDDVLFGTVGSVVRDHAGNAYVLDVQLSQIYAIAPDGKYLATLGREGEGPAEFRMAAGLALLSDTVLCVAQTMPARAVLITTDGRAAGTHPLPHDEGTPYLNGCSVFDGGLVLQIGELVERETSVGFRTAFVRLDREGNIVTTYWDMFQKADLANIEFDEKADAPPVWALGPNGRFYVNKDWDAYHIEVVEPGGKPGGVIEREYQHRARTARELEKFQAQKDSGEIPSETKVSETARDVARLFPRADGTLWVLSSRGEMEPPQGAVAAFDAFDASGAFARRVIIDGAFRPGRDDFYLVGDAVFVVTNGGRFVGEDDTGEMEVICLKFGS